MTVLLNCPSVRLSQQPLDATLVPYFSFDAILSQHFLTISIEMVDMVYPKLTDYRKINKDVLHL